ncbi:MAG: lipase maturation factor family protein [Acidimicrobiales bacterium]
MRWFSDPGYWLSRLVFTRGLALVYLIAFVVAANQFRALIGERGMLPVPRFVERTTFRRSPSLFHLHYSDRFFAVCCWTGAGCAVAALVGAVDAAPLWGWILVWLALWFGYLSIVNVGQVWYSFGWESLLLECGFLAVFLGPAATDPPRLVLWLLRWLLFRLEFGAGLIKLRGDSCWRDLTCLYYHHETQPMPNPMSRRFHHLSRRLHRIEALGNHVTQLVVVVVVFAPQPAASVAALIVIVTQAWLMSSGNFAWLNLLTIVIALSAVDGHLLGEVIRLRAPSHLASPTWFTAVVIALSAAVLVLSYWPIRNMLSGRQRMNASFNPYHLVNTYGAFGHVTRIRHEVVIEGTDDPQPGPDTEWKEYEFKGKPGDPRRRPRQVAPYHLRLDWLMWFAGISLAYARAWLPQLMVKLCQNDAATLKLLRSSPFVDSPPAFVRARLFRYRYTDAAEHREKGAWWDRAPVGELDRVGGSVAPGPAQATTGTRPEDDPLP